MFSFINRCTLRIQMLLEINKRRFNTINPSQHFCRIADCLIFQHQKVRQLLLIELLDPGFNVLGKHEFQKLFLFVIQHGEYLGLCAGDPCFPCNRFYGEGDIFQNIKQVALFSFNQVLKGGEFFLSISSFSEFIEQSSPGCRVRPDFPKLLLILEKIR